jgi:ElaB/YqjD/DUF883 family membrane-anchored ribosome-binding protein
MATRTETHPLTDQLSKSGHETLEKMSVPLGHAEDRLRETTYAAQNNVKAAVKRTRGNTREITNSVTGYIKEHPLATVGAAAAVGMVMGALFKSRS